jgi:uncharacterized membrane protein YuzA (DUF378 family)
VATNAALDILKWKDIVEAVERAINCRRGRERCHSSDCREARLRHGKLPADRRRGDRLIFDFVNGFHDAANSIATVVATRVLQPWQAVIWAAFWNFIAFAVLPLKVANEIAKIIDSDVVSIGLVFAGLVGAIVWNVVTAFLGLPSSSSHALIGGMVGAGIAKAGGMSSTSTCCRRRRSSSSIRRCSVCCWASC